jgi:hypothetical protein
MNMPTNELLEPLENGLPRVSVYNEFLKITKEDDTPETFQIWLQAAYTLMKPPAGNA